MAQNQCRTTFPLCRCVGRAPGGEMEGAPPPGLRMTTDQALQRLPWRSKKQGQQLHLIPRAEGSESYPLADLVP